MSKIIQQMNSQAGTESQNFRGAFQCLQQNLAWWLCWRDWMGFPRQPCPQLTPSAWETAAGLWGWVQFGCLRVAVCVGWFLGLERRVPGTRPGERSRLSVATAGAESHLRRHLVRLEIQLVSAFRQNWDSEGESESGMGVGRSPFIHCSPRLLLWEGVLPPSRMLKQGCPGGLGALWKPYPLLTKGDAGQSEAGPFVGIGRLCLKRAHFPGAARKMVS